MDRYAAAASWLLVASLALPSRHGVWALETAVAGDNKSDGSAWFLPEAIAKATGQEPIADWKEYLFEGPFGEEEGVGSTAAIFPPLRALKKNKNKKNKKKNGSYDSYQVDWYSGGGGVRGKWWPSITCPYGGAMQVEYYGQEQCIGVGQGLCKDGWQFGISNYDDNTYVMLWREDNPAHPVVRWFPGATSLCIGEQYPNVAYLRVTYDDCLYYLIGPGAGSADSLARLKIVDDTKRYKPNDVIVKFRDGPGDQNSLLEIFANGFSRISPAAMWYPMPCESTSPSSSPTDAPTRSPTNSPTASPTKSPTASPSASPSSSPSASPSALPSNGPSASPSTTPSATPSLAPSASPSLSSIPSSAPSTSSIPSLTPSDIPSSVPSSSPSLDPSMGPSVSLEPSARRPWWRRRTIWSWPGPRRACWTMPRRGYWASAIPSGGSVVLRLDSPRVKPFLCRYT